MIDYLILTVAIALLISGLLMVFFPKTLPRVEQTLNRPVGER